MFGLAYFANMSCFVARMAYSVFGILTLMSIVSGAVTMVADFMLLIVYISWWRQDKFVFMIMTGSCSS